MTANEMTANKMTVNEMTVNKNTRWNDYRINGILPGSNNQVKKKKNKCWTISLKDVFAFLVFSTSCGLYYKNIFTIVSDDHKWSLYYSVIYDRHLTLASIINYDRKWRYNLERHTSSVNYDCNKFIIQATAVSLKGLGQYCKTLLQMFLVS
jgi:hypothetical protein